MGEAESVAECSGRARISKEKVCSASSPRLPAINCIKLVPLPGLTLRAFVQPSLSGQLNWGAVPGLLPSLVPGTCAMPVPVPVPGERACTGLCGADGLLGAPGEPLQCSALGHWPLLSQPLSWALCRGRTAPCFYAGFQKATSIPVISPLLRKWGAHLVGGLKPSYCISAVQLVF